MVKRGKLTRTQRRRLEGHRLEGTSVQGITSSHRCKGSADRSFVAQLRRAKLRTLILDSELITAHFPVMDTAEPDLLENGVLHFPAWTSTTCGSRYPVLTSRLNLARKVATLSTMETSFAIARALLSPETCGGTTLSPTPQNLDPFDIIG